MRRTYAIHLSGLFCGILICALMLSGKIVSVGPLVFPASIVLFPATFLISDVLVEVYGLLIARSVIWSGLAVEIVWMAAYWIAAGLPAAPFWHGQDAFVATLGVTPRIALAGMIAYIIGELLAARVMDDMKSRAADRALALRLVASTVIGAGADTIIVVAIAFIGIHPLPALVRMAFTVWALKVLWEIAALPISLPIIQWLKRREGAGPT